MAGRPGQGREARQAAVVDTVLARLAEGQSLRAICRARGMPAVSTVRRWVVDDVDGFAARYARARDLGLDAMAEELLEIADAADGDREAMARCKLRVDTRKWYLEKLAPRRYAEAETGPAHGALAARLEEARRRLAGEAADSAGADGGEAEGGDDA